MHELRVAIAERFVAGADLHALVLPGDAFAAFSGASCRVWVVAEAGDDWRTGGFEVAGQPGAEVALGFPAFANPAGAVFHVFVSDTAGSDRILPAAFRAHLSSSRDPIRLGMPAGAAPALPAVPPRGCWVTEDGRAGSCIGTTALRLASDLGTYWRDQFGAHASGWLHCYAVPVSGASLALGNRSVPLTLHLRPDVVAHYPECGPAVPVGFKGYVPGEPGAALEVVIETGQGMVRRELPIPDRLRTLPAAPDPVPPSQRRFVAVVNEQRLRVLEIGSRVVGPDAVNWRERMPGASAYVGLDVHPSAHVDIVGDAHRLTEFVGSGRFDAIWSAEVFEHLQMPWLAAAEINRALRMGGLTFHMAPHTWPLHEMPADYWRVSDQALRVLFGPAFGFEVLQAELIEPMAIHPPRRDGAWQEMPVFPGYGHAAVLSRKVAELPAMSGMEAWARDRLSDAARLYPETDRAERERMADMTRGEHG